MGHKRIEEVHKILKQSKAIQNIFFEKKRLEGMYEHNIHALEDTTTTVDQLMRERQPKTKDTLQMCAGCNKFISHRAFYKHRDAVLHVTLKFYFIM
jgi:hypothetical protein